MQDALRPAGATSTKAPKLMGRFHCEALLYSEGLLETWRARVQGLSGFDRVFAVKCLVAGALSRRSRAAEDLLKSARSVATLKDPRVATVMDSGLAPGSAFVATEFIHGVSLRELREWVHGRATEEGGRPASWPVLVIHVAAEIAGALAVTHASEPQLVHGALAAGSVMVTPQGGIKLVDLGLFAAVHTPTEIAASPVRRPCAAPELSRGMAPTAAADLYALGALLLELASGRERRASGNVEAGSSWSRVLSAELQALMRQLLSIEPRERPPADLVEATLRESVAAVRGLDMHGELGQLVRRMMQSSGSQGASDLAREGDAADVAPGFAAGMDAVDQNFIDEPTQVLAVADDGAPTKLAGILRDMRGERADEDGTVIDGARLQLDQTPVHLTPARGTLIDVGPDELHELPELPELSELPELHAAIDLSDDDEPTTAFSVDEANATIVQAGPLMDPTDVMNPRMAAELRAAARLPPPERVAKAGVPEEAPRPMPFEDFSAEVAAAPSSLTPAGWQPSDLEGPTETDRAALPEEGLPLTAEVSPAARRWPRVLVVVVAAAALAAGVLMMARSRSVEAPPSVSAGR